MNDAQLTDLRSRAREYRRQAVSDGRRMPSSIGFHRGLLLGIGINVLSVIAALSILATVQTLPYIALALLAPPVLWTMACRSAGAKAFQGALVGHVVTGVLLFAAFMALVSALGGGVCC